MGRLSLCCCHDGPLNDDAAVSVFPQSDEQLSSQGNNGNLFATPAAPAGRLADSLLTARKLGESGRVIVAAPDYLARCSTPTKPEDLHRHNCLNFNFRRAEPVWPFRVDGRDITLSVKGNIEANNGETLGQLAAAGVGIARVGAFSVADDLAAGRLVPILEDYNPGDVELIHAVFVGGTNTPTRVRVFVDFLAAHLAA